MHTLEKRKGFIKWAIVAGFLFLWLFTCWLPRPGHAAAPAMPKFIVLDDSDKENSKFAGGRGKTPFDHEQHVAKETSCVICHHTNTSKLTEKMEEEVLKCAVCHTDEDENPIPVEGINAKEYPKGRKARISKEAYHGKNSLVGCIGCHEQRSIEPTGCDDCHTKKETIEYKYKKALPSPAAAQAKSNSAASK